MRYAALEKERDSQLHELALLESKLSIMQHEQDLVVKLKNQAVGSTHHQVKILSIRFPHPSFPHLDCLQLSLSLRVHEANFPT